MAEIRAISRCPDSQTWPPAPSFINGPPSRRAFSSNMAHRSIDTIAAGTGRARRYTLRIHPSDREAILTMPPRGTLADAKEFAQRHGARSPRRLGRLPKAAPFFLHRGPVARHPHRIVTARARAERLDGNTDSGERILCVAAVLSISSAASVITSSTKRAAICKGRAKLTPPRSASR